MQMRKKYILSIVRKILIAISIVSAHLCALSYTPTKANAQTVNGGFHCNTHSCSGSGGWVIGNTGYQIYVFFSPFGPTPGGYMIMTACNYSTGMGFRRDMINRNGKLYTYITPYNRPRPGAIAPYRQGQPWGQSWNQPWGRSWNQPWGQSRVPSWGRY